VKRKVEALLLRLNAGTTAAALQEPTLGAVSSTLYRRGYDVAILFVVRHRRNQSLITYSRLASLRFIADLPDQVLPLPVVVACLPSRTRAWSRLNCAQDVLLPPLTSGPEPAGELRKRV
jgi:hypothetical protein